MLEERVRARMSETVKKREKVPFVDLVAEEAIRLESVGEGAREQWLGILRQLPLAYSNVPAIFRSVEQKKPGAGGLFAIFVSDLCKGCGECVQVCGDHDALRMTRGDGGFQRATDHGPDLLAVTAGNAGKYLGLYNDEAPETSRDAALRNHLMVRRNYEALVSGDGACAGCGEKSMLRACASVTEAYLRPMYHRKADRLRSKADRLEQQGVVRLEALRQRDPAQYHAFRIAGCSHMVMGLGGENDEDTAGRAAHERDHGPITDAEVVGGLVAVLRQDAFDHRDLQAVDGRKANGMSVMLMGRAPGATRCMDRRRRPIRIRIRG
jgi:pyruvate-ferredoxin/flavodoxin oxidoreductase